MVSEDDSDPADRLPADLVTAIDELDRDGLRAVIDHARRRRHERVPSSTIEELVAREDDHIVRVDEREGFTEVVKYQACASGCEDCPHGPYLYHVFEEPRPEGGTSLHWVYIGTATPEAGD